MEIAQEEDRDSIQVHLRGDIYVEQGEELMKTFQEIIRRDPAQVILNLSGLNTITSSGIGKIVLLYKEMDKKGGTVTITGVNNTIMQIFKIVKLDKLMQIEPL
jgi:anti-anti-sigma factor